MIKFDKEPSLGVITTFTITGASMSKDGKNLLIGTTYIDESGNTQVCRHSCNVKSEAAMAFGIAKIVSQLGCKNEFEDLKDLVKTISNCKGKTFIALRFIKESVDPWGEVSYFSNFNYNKEILEKIAHQDDDQEDEE